MCLFDEFVDVWNILHHDLCISKISLFLKIFVYKFCFYEYHTIDFLHEVSINI